MLSNMSVHRLPGAFLFGSFFIRAELTNPNDEYGTAAYAEDK